MLRKIWGLENTICDHRDLIIPTRPHRWNYPCDGRTCTNRRMASAMQEWPRKRFRRIVLGEVAKLSGQCRKILFLSTLWRLYPVHRRPRGSTCPLDFLQKGDLFISRSVLYLRRLLHEPFFFLPPFLPYLPSPAVLWKTKETPVAIKRELVGINNVFNNAVWNAHGK